MSSSHHDDQYLQEQKPIAFTVPFILASVLILIIFLFVSLCDPKPHHVAGAAHHEQMSPGEAAGYNDAMEAHENTATSETGMSKAPGEGEKTASKEQPGAEHH